MLNNNVDREPRFAPGGLWDLLRHPFAFRVLFPGHSGQPISCSAYSFSCLQSPVFQSLRSESLSTCAVCSVQHSSVLSLKRTRRYSIPSSKTCSTQSTILP